MPNTASAAKQMRQSRKRRSRNRAAKSTIKTLTRRLLQAIESGNREASLAALSRVESALDKAAKKKILHPNNASRKKSRIARRFHAAFASPPAEDSVTA